MPVKRSEGLKGVKGISEFPLFRDLLTPYLLEVNPNRPKEDVLTDLFGSAIAKQLGNSCAARLSVALNGAGAQIPPPTTTDHGVLVTMVHLGKGNKPHTPRHHSTSVLHVLPRKDISKGYCAIKANELSTYLKARFGPPSIEFTPPETVSARKLIAGATGIIAFEMLDSRHPFSIDRTGYRPTGHIDLWNGSKFLEEDPKEDYFAPATRVSFWIIANAVT